MRCLTNRDMNLFFFSIDPQPADQKERIHSFKRGSRTDISLSNKSAYPFPSYATSAYSELNTKKSMHGSKEKMDRVVSQCCQKNLHVSETFKKSFPRA